MLKQLTIFICFFCVHTLLVMEKNNVNPQYNEYLFQACKKGDEDRIAKLIANGADPLYVDQNNNNCLHITKKASTTRALIRCIEELPDCPIPISEFINAMNKQGKTPLHVAVAELKLEKVKLLLEHGAIADHPDNTGETPFHLIVRKKRLFHEKNDFSDMPKQILTDDLRFNVLELLCKWGGDINKPNLLLDTPLHLALSQDSVKPDLVKDLLVLGAQLKSINQLGKSPLSLACELKNYEKFFEGLFTDVELPGEHNQHNLQKVFSLKELSFRQLFFLLSSHEETTDTHAKKHNKKFKLILKNIVEQLGSIKHRAAISLIFAEFLPKREIGTIYKALTFACKKYLKNDGKNTSLSNIQLLLYQTINSKYVCVKKRWINAFNEPENKQTLPIDIKKTLLSELNQIISPELIAYQNNFLEQYLTLRIQELTDLIKRINEGIALAKNLEVIQYEPRLKQIANTIEGSLKLIQEALVDVKKKKSSQELAKTYILPEQLDQYNTEVDYTLRFLSKIKRIYKMNQKLFTIIKITELLKLETFIPFIIEVSQKLKQKIEEYHNEFKQINLSDDQPPSVMSEEEVIDLYKEIKSTFFDLYELLSEEEINQLQNYFRNKSKSRTHPQ